MLSRDVPSMTWPPPSFVRGKVLLSLVKTLSPGEDGSYRTDVEPPKENWRFDTL